MTTLPFWTKNILNLVGCDNPITLAMFCVDKFSPIETQKLVSIVPKMTY